MTPKKKMGRPKTDNPMNNEIRVRLTAGEIATVEKYCAEHHLLKTQFVRIAIKEFLKEK